MVRGCGSAESVIDHFVTLRLSYKTIIALKRDRVLGRANMNCGSYALVPGICEKQVVALDPPTALNRFRVQISLHAPGTVSVKDACCTVTIAVPLTENAFRIGVLAPSCCHGGIEYHANTTDSECADHRLTR
jgi:hypothetical protein